jgi:hypothetical protein
MVLNTESKYPNRRAYVLKLRADATPAALAGRLENLVSGRQHEFGSVEGLLASLASDLACEPTPGAQPDAPPDIPFADAAGD